MKRTALAALLVPLAADASFNAAPCHTFGCHFEMIGIFLGLLGGVPISGVIFVILHLANCNPERSKTKQLFLGGFLGIVTFELSAAAAAYVATAMQTTIDHNQYYPLAALLAVFILCAYLSVRYARSDP